MGRAFKGLLRLLRRNHNLLFVVVAFGTTLGLAAGSGYRLFAPPAQLPGGGHARRRTPYVPPNAAAIRDYHPGDSFNRIHWPSTARLNRLMVKTFEMDPTSDIFLLLDLDAAVQAGKGDDSTEEYGVRIAASLAAHFLEANRMLGLLTFGSEKVALEPARGAQHYFRILEALTLAKADGGVPLAKVLQGEERRFGRHTTIIVLTPRPRPGRPRPPALAR